MDEGVAIPMAMAGDDLGKARSAMEGARAKMELAEKWLALAELADVFERYPELSPVRLASVAFAQGSSGPRCFATFQAEPSGEARVQEGLEEVERWLCRCYASGLLRAGLQGGGIGGLCGEELREEDAEAAAGWLLEQGELASWAACRERRQIEAAGAPQPKPRSHGKPRI